MLAEILPSGVAVVERTGAFAGSLLLKSEQDFIVNAAPRRVAEFAAGRACARQALASLGFPPQPILRAAGREPIWPRGAVGSITHCDGYCAAAVARAAEVAALGIDAEPNEPLAEGTLEVIACEAELREVNSCRALTLCWDRLLFCAKESVFKAWYPIAHRWLGFEQVCIAFQPEDNAFEARFDASAQPPAGLPAVWRGRFAAEGQYLVTAVALRLDAPIPPIEPAKLSSKS